jgi:pyruvate oxidase
VRQPEAKSLQTALDYINRAKKPVAFIGTGARSAATEIREFLEKQSMPFVATLPAKGIIGDKHPNYLGNLGKLGTKPAYEALHEADLILLIGTNYPYVDYLPEDATFIQIDHSAKNIGKRRAVDVAIHADISAVMPALLAQLPARDDDTFLRATQKAVAQWESWLDDKRLADDTPLAPAAVAHLISEYAPADAIFSIDVGTTISWTARFLPVMPTQRYLVSAWLGTMGYALPSAIATSLAAPNRQSYAITGDGGFAMVMQDFLTAVKYHLPVVTVIFNNQQLGFIELEQQGAGQRHFGIDLEDMDYAAFAQSAGGVGYNIRTRDELIAALGASRRIHDRPILLNVYVANDTPIPGKILVDEMKGFATYAARSVAKGEMPDIPPLKEIMRQL